MERLSDDCEEDQGEKLALSKLRWVAKPVHWQCENRYSRSYINKRGSWRATKNSGAVGIVPGLTMRELFMVLWEISKSVYAYK